jgi:predicted RND superfamily exporter protein
MMNMAIFPMLLGVGIDYGIYIVHCLQFHQGSTLQRALQVTGTAIGLSALTTLIGFGTLTLLVAFVGITACLLASLGTLPSVLHLWGLYTDTHHESAGQK